MKYYLIPINNIFLRVLNLKTLTDANLVINLIIYLSNQIR